MNVLIVDDSDRNASKMFHFFSLKGYEVEIINDADKVLDDIKVVNNFDVIILDVIMPLRRYFGKISNQAGIIILNNIREFSSIPVIICSAMNYSALRSSTKHIENLHFFSKPVNLEYLASFLKIV